MATFTISNTRMEKESPLASQTRTSNPKNEVLYNSRQSNFKKDFTKEASFRSMNRSMNRSVSGGSHGPGLLPGHITQMHTSKIVNRALEVMSKTLKDADYTPQKPVKSVDDGDTSDESETAHSPSDCSNSDNDIDVPPQPVEPPSRLGNLTAQLSFRKIAKKRRKAGGQSSFHHTKSSKEYLRKAQEAYQRLKISEQEQENNQRRQLQLESSRDTIEKSKSASPIKTKESKPIDYGYGDTSKTVAKDEVDYGYGVTTESPPDKPVDYGYGDAGGQSLFQRRGGKPKRRNSVTKYSAQAANVVAAQAAAQRILKLNPSITSTSRSPTHTTRRLQLEDRPQRSNSTQVRDVRGRRSGNIAKMQTSLQKQHKQKQDNENKSTEMSVDRLESPQRPLRRGDRGSVMQSPRLQVTSDYFSSDPKPKNLIQRNTGRVNGGPTFRFTAPARTSSWLSNDTLNKTDDDEDFDCDVDSLASDMESLCSFRDSSFRDNSFRDSSFRDSSSHKNSIDMPPVLPGSDRRSRFGGRSISGDMIRRPLVVSFSNGSNKCRSLRERSGSNDFSILPPVGVVTTNGSASKSCMPAPVRRTPSYKGAQQRHD